MNLDFATEAARRGCPYVVCGPDVRGGEVLYFQPHGLTQIEWKDQEVSESMLSRFACGATLALWWELEAHKQEALNWKRECWDFASHAATFARGIK